MSPLWWHWIVLGLALTVFELAVPSFFIIWFGLGALVVGVSLLLWPGLEFTPQMTLCTGASISFAAFWFTVLRKQGGDTCTGQAAEALGEIGVLVSAVEPFQRGEVRFQKPVMGAEVWPCIADATIAAGARVRVGAVDGQLLKVVAL